ncbi:Helix-turn-helix domain-containing protein [Prauserella marina]|uniref:Helix-turn-helix domain-containing protein n=2 Tax=Prauserella marina TaxID=530584 RepID=A0A1G6SSY0_9PSEU|nr:helix-turn-helix protein [Prauserella marina]SDD19235.1 Helix-turn-helix domain-containing protein [Prauserella marina]
MVDIAAEAGISVETLRKIETGRIPTPAFFTVVALANAVGVPLDELRDLADSTDSADGVRGAGETVPVANQGSVSLPAVS